MPAAHAKFCGTYLNNSLSTATIPRKGKFLLDFKYFDSILVAYSARIRA